jgi:NitT/TauT family transport system permease protein
MWAVVVHAFKIKPYIIPAPETVFFTFIDRFGLLSFHALPTLLETALGLILSVIVGVPLAVAIVSSRSLERMLMPLLVGSQCFPKIAIGPILIVWFGWGMLPKILIAFFISIFPIVIQTVLGLKSVERDEIDLIRTMSAKPHDVFMKIRVPNALPHFFAGLKVSVTLALIGAIVGEFIGADRGLGYLLQYANNELNTPLLFAAIVYLIGLGGGLFVAVIYLEKLMIPWHVAVREDGQRQEHFTEKAIQGTA